MNNYAGIEAGGTKFVCAIARGPDDTLAEITLPTTSPLETMERVVDFFLSQERLHGEIDALGIATFGPIDPNPQSETFGFISATPKPGWANFDLVGSLRKEFNIPIGFDTDVNGAALGEWRWGAAQGLDTFIYLTIGTGIGGGGMVNGKLIHGLIHPEMGHIRIPHDTVADPFPGVCPFHENCFEGLANGPAIEARWGQPGESLPEDHPAWELEANYLALALVNYICCLSPQRIIIGGGVMQRTKLYPIVRRRVQQILNNYIQADQILLDIDQYIVPPALGKRSGVLGAIALAIQAKKNQDLR